MTQMTLYIKSRKPNQSLPPAATVETEEDEKDAQMIDWNGWKMLHGLGIAADRMSQKSPAVAKEAIKAYGSIATAISKIHPCGICRTHMNNYKKKPDWPGQAFQWSVDLHNDVNRRTGKPTMPLHVARQHWIGKNPVLDDILLFFQMCASKSEKPGVQGTAGQIPLQWSHSSVKDAIVALVHLCEAGNQGQRLKTALESSPLPAQFSGKADDSKYFEALREACRSDA